MCEQFVKPSSDFKQFPRRLLLKNALSRLLEVDFPVKVHDGLIASHRVLLDLAGFQHKKSAPKDTQFMFRPLNKAIYYDLRK